MTVSYNAQLVPDNNRTLSSVAAAPQTRRSDGGMARPQPWVWAVLVLAFCHAEAIASFQILNILVEPIKAALGVTDIQYSLMQGLAVAVFASLLGIPAAIAADRGSRRRVVMVGIVIWSGATVACGLAESFWQLFAGRMLVGVGEVFLFPAALSMIADVAPPNRLSSAIGIFGCGGPIGTALALVGGGWLMRHQDLIAGKLPWSTDAVWRTAFFLCGAFGALALGFLLTVPEPRRCVSVERIQKTVNTTVMHLRLHWRAFLGVSGGMLALSFCVFATSSWAPTLLVRVHGLSYSDTGTIVGFAALAGGMLGAWAVGFLTDKIEANGRRDAALQVSIAVSGLILVTVVLAVVTRSPGLAAVFLCATYSLLGMPTVLAGTALQQISPPEIRAQVMAVQVLLVNVLALSLGPLTVAVLTDDVFGRPAAVGYALAWTDSAGALLAIAAFLASRRRFAQQRL
jgi:MFS family permease